MSKHMRDTDEVLCVTLSLERAIHTWYTCQTNRASIEVMAME